MAGIYIKNMEMPEKCEDCRFWDGQNNGCPIVHMITLRRTHQKKPDWCPLVEVPDHGDLIDKSVLYDHIKEGYDIDFQEDQILLNAILEIVDYQEAIIQADKEEA